MQNMTPEEYLKFMTTTDPAHTGKLATVRADGRPHVAPIWFIMDGEDLVFMTWHTSIKGKNIQRDNRVSICLDEEQPPFSFVVFEGTAHIEQVSAGELVAWAARIGGRYMGEDQAEAYGQRNGVEGELLIRVIPTKILAKKNISD